MRIVFDNIVFSLQRRGGISVVWKEIVSRFIRDNNDKLSFIEYETNNKNMFHNELSFPRDSVVLRNPLFFIIERYRDLKIKINEPFIFHSSYFRLCRNKNAINITTVHDFTYEFAYRNRRGSFLHIWQRNKAIRKADAVVCISENTKRDLIKYLPEVDKKKLYVIYNAASSDYRVLDKKNPDYKDYLLFVGDRSYYKNGEWFADCIKDTSYKVLFCGNEMDEKEKDYYDKVLGPERYFVKVGLSNEELNLYYNSVKCLVYPSSYEGFGIPIIEAQSAGCPVVAYNSSSIPEVIGDTPLIMNELSKEELIGKIELLNDPIIRQDVIKKGIVNSKRFSWDVTYEKYRELYANLLGRYQNL